MGSAPPARQCPRSSIRCGNAIEQLGGQLVLGIQSHDFLELCGRGIGVSAGQVVIGQQESRLRCRRVRFCVLLQGAELLRVDIHVRIEAAQRRPIPAGTGGQHGIVCGSRFLVASQREEHQAAELVEHGVVGHLRNGLVHLGQRGRIVALHEGVPRRIEQGRRLLLGGRTRLCDERRSSRLSHHDRLRVIDGCTAVDDRTRVVRVVVRPISPGPGNRGKAVTAPAAAPAAPAAAPAHPSPSADYTKTGSSCRANPRGASRRGSNRHASAGRGCSSG